MDPGSLAIDTGLVLHDPGDSQIIRAPPLLSRPGLGDSPMRLPTWLTLCRRARRNRRRLNPVPVVESLEDRTLLTLFWDFDPGIGHLEFTTDDASTSRAMV